MKKGKVVSLLLTTALAATLLSGCGKTGTEIAGETKSKPAMEQVAVVEQVVMDQEQLALMYGLSTRKQLK